MPVAEADEDTLGRRETKRVPRRRSSKTTGAGRRADGRQERDWLATAAQPHCRHTTQPDW